MSRWSRPVNRHNLKADTTTLASIWVPQRHCLVENTDSIEVLWLSITIWCWMSNKVNKERGGQRGRGLFGSTVPLQAPTGKKVIMAPKKMENNGHREANTIPWVLGCWSHRHRCKSLRSKKMYSSIKVTSHYLLCPHTKGESCSGQKAAVEWYEPAEFWWVVMRTVGWSRGSVRSRRSQHCQEAKCLCSDFMPTK